MITIEEKREACVKYETDWLCHGARRGDLEDLMRNGFTGWANMTDDAVERFYKDNIEEESQ